MKIQTHYYSERGLVNCLILWLTKESKDNSESNIIKFLNKIEYINEKYKTKLTDKKIRSVDLFDEFSFGAFGSPDLIIKVQTINNKFYYFMIEAKINSFEEACSVGNDIIFKDNASKIDIQLVLRKRFIYALRNARDNFGDEQIQEISQDEYGYKTTNTRALKKEELINWVKKTFRSKQSKFYYIALTNDDNNDVTSIYSSFLDKKVRKYPKNVKTRINKTEFGLIKWKDLTDLGMDNLKETCGYTFDKAHNPFKMK